MKIKIINPNTTKEFTDGLRACAEECKRPDTEILCVNPPEGPSAIEGFYDEALAVPHVLKEIVKGVEEENVDAFVLACFGDPGIYAAREITKKPVIGIAEAGFHMAALAGAGFSIVTSAPRMRLMTEHLLERYGCKSLCRSLRTTPIHVLDLAKNPGPTIDTVVEECNKAKTEDHAEVIVLGCAGMSPYRADIERRVGIPVVDGTVAAIGLCETMVNMKLFTSKCSTFDYPVDYKGVKN